MINDQKALTYQEAHEMALDLEKYKYAKERRLQFVPYDGSGKMRVPCLTVCAPLRYDAAGKATALISINLYHQIHPMDVFTMVKSMLEAYQMGYQHGQDDGAANLTAGLTALIKGQKR
jgi:hypothetical protein